MCYTGPMELMSEMVDYFFALCVAASALYFYVTILKLKHIKDYAKLKKAKEDAPTALAALFSSLVLWGVVHMTLVAIG